MKLEKRFLSDPAVARDLVPNGEQMMSRFDPATGATRGNLELRNGVIAIEGQRNAELLVQSGLISGRPEVLDLGLRGIEWALSDAVLGDGTFPPLQPEPNPNKICVFIAAAITSAVSVREVKGGRFCVDADRPVVARADRILDRVWLAISTQSETDAFHTHITTTKATNQRLFAAYALMGAAVAREDESLMIRARTLLSNIVALQWEDGTFPEAGGFDWSYQTVSVRLLTAFMGLMGGRRRDLPSELMVSLTRAVERLVASLDETGAPPVAGSRTKFDRPPTEGTQPKGDAIDQYHCRLRYANLILRDAAVTLAADSLKLRGPSYEHIDNL